MNRDLRSEKKSAQMQNLGLYAFWLMNQDLKSLQGPPKHLWMSAIIKENGKIICPSETILKCTEIYDWWSDLVNQFFKFFWSPLWQDNKGKQH
jgi:hypothetical protein